MGGVAKAVGGILGGGKPKQTAAAEATAAVQAQPPVQPPAPPKPEAVPQAPTGVNPNQTGLTLTKSQVEGYIKNKTGLDIEARDGAANAIIKERGLEQDFANWQKQIGAIAGNATEQQRYEQQQRVILEPPPGAVQQQDRSVLAARDRERRRRLRMAAKNNTIITGGAGVTAPAPAASKQLFGQ